MYPRAREKVDEAHDHLPAPTPRGVEKTIEVLELYKYIL